MKILVQKFGGTSVATPESRELVYKKILRAKEDGYSLVVVISAMGRKGEPYATDTLLDLIRNDCPRSRLRELDQIFVCGEIIAGSIVTANLQQKGHKAAYLTGGQAGIITNNNYGDARIININTGKIMSLLTEGNIVIVAGSQGATEDGEITTLGRGGSDTTGCALGVALDAEKIEIYTDVDGVMTTDPRIVPEARLFQSISYENCIKMAYQGAKVMHPRAVEIASQKPHIQLYVKSVFNDSPGTLICSSRQRLPDNGADIPNVCGAVGVTLVDKQVILRAKELPSGYKTVLIQELSSKKIDFCDICPYIDETLLVSEEKDIEKIEKVITDLNIKGQWIRGLSRISVIGDNLMSAADVFTSYVDAIENIGIEVVAISVRNKAINIWVESKHAAEAIKSVHSLLLAP